MSSRKSLALNTLRGLQIILLILWYLSSEDPGNLYYIPILSNTGVFPFQNLILAVIFVLPVMFLNKLKRKFGLIGEKEYF
jgi:hypothetical protein